MNVLIPFGREYKCPCCHGQVSAHPPAKCPNCGKPIVVPAIIWQTDPNYGRAGPEDFVQPASVTGPSQAITRWYYTDDADKLREHIRELERERDRLLHNNGVQAEQIARLQAMVQANERKEEMKLWE